MKILDKLRDPEYKFPKFDIEKLSDFFRTKVTIATADTIAWVAIILIHAATVPGMLALSSGLSDKTPPIDLILFIWAGLCLYFIRAAILRDTLMVLTIGFGFIIHSVMLALVLFK